MSDFKRQFVLYLTARNRWRWFLYDEGMDPIAGAYRSYRSYDECIQSARDAVGIALGAAIWDAEHQRWDESGPPLHVATLQN